MKGSGAEAVVAASVRGPSGARAAGGVHRSGAGQSEVCCACGICHASRIGCACGASWLEAVLEMMRKSAPRPISEVTRHIEPPENLFSSQFLESDRKPYRPPVFR